MHCTDIRKLRFIIRKTSSRRAPVDERDYARPLPQCSSCSTFVGVSGDGMQEPPNESDASVSLIIVFGSYICSLLVVFYIYLYCLFIPFWIRILGQNILINQSKSTEHKFGGLEALRNNSVKQLAIYSYM